MSLSKRMLPMDIQTTPYGQISRTDNGWTFIVANAQETYDWAHRPNKLWPNSALSSYPVEIAINENGDLIDLQTEAHEFLMVGELSAFITDIIFYTEIQESQQLLS